MEGKMNGEAFSKRFVRLSGRVVVCAGIFALAGCYYMPGLAGSGMARANVGVSKALPANIASLALIVGGPGMDTIANTYAVGTTTTTLTIPSGAARTFTLLVSSPSASLIGSSTVDLAPGETRTVTLSPAVAGTQIVIPDYLNGRIVQISDIAGTGWVAKVQADFTSVTSFLPWAVDFDEQGRIYIANNTASSTDPGVIRIDDINHTSTFTKVDATFNTGIKSLAVDRTNGLVYYCTATATTLYMKDINNVLVAAATSTLSSDGILTPPASITVDDQGILYMAIPGATAPAHIVKYNPNLAIGTRALASSTYALSSPWGIMVRGPYVYVTDSGAGTVVRFDKNLNFVDSYSPPLARPETFLATLNRKITLIDEGSSGATDRIDSFDDMTGAGLETFGSNGSGTNQFAFYSIC
jgi:hypothetical protein